jgi:ABC-type oligopeptide transport system substrate-binding subunit
MALDRQEVIRIALKDEVDLANGIVPPTMPGWKTDTKPLPYDPTKAKQLLAQAGYPDGKGFPALTISYRQDQPEVGETAQVLAQQWKTNLGVDIQMRPMEWAQFLIERQNKTMPLFHLRWAADYLDPQDFLSVMLHTSRKINGQEDHPENGVGYSSPEFDRLCDAADVEHDPQKRMTLYQQAEQIAVNDAPWIPLYFKKDLELVKPRVGNIRDSLFGHLPHVTTTVTQ